MLDRLLPEVLLHVVSHLSAEDLYFCRYLCRQLRALASPDFAARLRPLFENYESVKFADVIRRIRSTGQARLGRLCLEPDAVGRLLVLCGAKADSLFCVEVARRVAPTPEERGLLFFGARVRPGVLRAIVDSERLLSRVWGRSEDSVMFLLATGLPRSDLCRVLLDLDSPSFAEKWNAIALLQGWWTPNWVPEDPEPGPEVREGLRFFFENLDDPHLYAEAIGSLVYQWENGSLPAVVNLCPWKWSDRGRIVAEYANAANDTADEDPDETIATFLRRFFVETPAGQAVAETDRKSFFSGLRRGLLDEDLDDPADLFFVDELWPTTAGLQALDFLARDAATKDLLVNVMLNDRVVDISRVARFFRAHPLPCRDYLTAISDYGIAEQKERFAALIGGVDFDVRDLANFVALLGTPAVSMDWFPKKRYGTESSFSASEIGEMLAWVAHDQLPSCSDSVFRERFGNAVNHLVTWKLSELEGRFEKNPQRMIKTYVERAGALAALASSFLRTLVPLYHRNTCFALLGVLASYRETFSLRTVCRVVSAIAASFELYGDVRSFVFGHALGSKILPISALPDAISWTWAAPTSEPVSAALLDHPDIMGADMAARMGPAHRRTLLAGLWDKIELLDAPNVTLLCSVADRDKIAQQTGEAPKSRW
ncbi:hypothetical protein DFJ74DRAFT_686482 [Hyaloraphidium curvatum]|nr:hypothetical protein DFJ74DRAFT_686482 [Hyaloraphidium curvatum]